MFPGFRKKTKRRQIPAIIQSTPLQCVGCLMRQLSPIVTLFVRGNFYIASNSASSDFFNECNQKYFLWKEKMWTIVALIVIAFRHEQNLISCIIITDFSIYQIKDYFLVHKRPILFLSHPTRKYWKEKEEIKQTTLFLGMMKMSGQMDVDGRHPMSTRKTSVVDVDQ